MATLVGLSLGIFTGSPRRDGCRRSCAARRWCCVSLPPLVTSLLLVFVAARTGWLPAGGMVSAAASDPRWPAWIADVAWHLPLPVLALALPIAATFERLQSQSMAEAVHQPFVLAAIARGVSARRALVASRVAGVDPADLRVYGAGHRGRCSPDRSSSSSSPRGPASDG